MLDGFASLFAQNPAAILSIGGFAIGLVFGAIVLTTNFCTMGAIADIFASGDYRRFRSWILAAAVALTGTQILAAAGAVDLSQSIYMRGALDWFGSLAGGLIFGFGMVLAGGCPSRNIVRAGAGDLRALTGLLVLGLSAHIAMGGLLGPVRRSMQDMTEMALPTGVTTSLTDLVAHIGGVSGEGWLRLAVAVLLAGAAFLYCFGDARFRSSWRHVVGGVAVGLCVVAGWVVTALAQDDFAEVRTVSASLSFVRPVADTIDYLARFTAMKAVGFGVAVTLGSVAGALGAALATGRFRLAGFANSADTARNLAGAALMGVGGVMALGCSIGQGVTGISTMTLGAFLAFAAMAMGAVLGVKYLERSL